MEKDLFPTQRLRENGLNLGGRSGQTSPRVRVVAISTFYDAVPIISVKIYAELEFAEVIEYCFGDHRAKYLCYSV